MCYYYVVFCNNNNTEVLSKTLKRYALGEDRTHIPSFGGLCVIHYTTRARDLSIIQIEAI